MVAELTKNERQGALIILLVLAVTGLAMAAGGHGDPFGIHGALVMVVAIAGIFAVIAGYYAPEPPESRLDSYYDTPTKFGIVAAKNLFKIIFAHMAIALQVLNNQLNFFLRRINLFGRSA